MWLTTIMRNVLPVASQIHLGMFISIAPSAPNGDFAANA